MDFPQLIAVVPEKVIHRLNADANGGQWAVLIQVAEGEVWLAGLLDDLFNEAAYESVVTTFEVG